MCSYTLLLGEWARTRFLLVCYFPRDFTTVAVSLMIFFLNVLLFDDLAKVKHNLMWNSTNNSNLICFVLVELCFFVIKHKTLLLFCLNLIYGFAAFNLFVNILFFLDAKHFAIGIFDFRTTNIIWIYGHPTRYGSVKWVVLFT